MRDRPRGIFRDRHRHPGPPPAQKPSPSRYVALVPYLHHIEDGCERQLRQLELAGVEVCRLPGCSAIDFCRSQLLSVAMLEGKEAVLFIDSDIVFNVEDALRILARPEPIVAGIYAQKKIGKLNANFGDNETPVRFGKGGGDRELHHVGAGFLRITADACKTIVEHHDLPCCTAGAGSSPVFPFFLPMVKRVGEEHRYFGEDFAFCERAREAGLKVIGDTTIRLFHLGTWPFSWEEGAGMKIDRVDSVEIRP